MEVLIFSFFTAFTLVYFAIPSIINIARIKRIFDEPGERSSHKVSTPSLGGIAIFAGAMFSITMWTPFADFGKLQYILCALIIIFLLGAKDDISPVSPTKKIVAQLMAAAILVFKSDIHLRSFYGLFGLEYQLPLWMTAMISIFTILVIINAFNLIDGINGLAGCVGTLISITFGCYFFVVGAVEYATVAFALAGAILAFLKYNVTPAQIFMGDTGSLILGTVSAMLAIKFIDLCYYLPASEPLRFNNALAVAVGIMIIPLFDTVRVFTTRILRGKSPFSADRRHIHHLLIDFGFSHMQATTVLVAVNMAYICLVFAIDPYVELHVMLFIELASAAGLTYFLHRQVQLKRQELSLE